MIKMGNGDRIEMSEIKNILEEELKRRLYVLERYNHSGSMSFIYTPSINSRDFHKEIKNHIRKSDEVIQIHEELHVIFFNHVDYSGAFKACQKIIHEVSRLIIPINASIIEFSTSETVHSLIQKNITSLKVVQNNKDSTVADCISTSGIHH